MSIDDRSRGGIKSGLLGKSASRAIADARNGDSGEILFAVHFLQRERAT